MPADAAITARSRKASQTETIDGQITFVAWTQGIAERRGTALLLSEGLSRFRGPPDRTCCKAYPFAKKELSDGASGVWR